METLQAIRHEIATNLPQAQRPASLQDELLDEIYAADKAIEQIEQKQMGKYALIALDRDWYEVPPMTVAAVKEDHTSVDTQLQGMLFKEGAA